MLTTRTSPFDPATFRARLAPTLRRVLPGALALGLMSGAVGQTEVWGTTHSPALLFDRLAPAPSNGVYALGGRTLTDVRLLRIDDSGARLWERVIQYPNLEVLSPAGLAMTSSGGCVVVCGRRASVTGLRDSCIHVYDSNGGVVWQQIDTDPFVALPVRVVVGPADEIFVGSFSGIKKYSPTGVPQWSAFTPIVFGMTADGAGGVWASGIDNGSGSNPYAWVAHFDGAGNQLFFEVFGAGRFTIARSIAPDGVGGVYILGDSDVSLGGTPVSGIGCWLQRRDAAGAVRWTRTFGTVGHDHPSGVALDEFDNAIVAGYTNGGHLTAPNPHMDDSWLMRFDASGALVWGASVANAVPFPTIASLTVGTAGAVYVGGTMSSQASVSRFDNDVLPTVGVSYCSPAVPNSTGSPARLRVFGSNFTHLSEVTLLADALPAQSFGYFLTSANQIIVANPGGSQGVLCVGGAIGRFVGAGQIQNAGASSQFRLRHDLTNHPTPTGAIQVQAGETWNFQAWYRDMVGGVATSNFSDAVSVPFF